MARRITRAAGLTALTLTLAGCPGSLVGDLMYGESPAEQKVVLAQKTDEIGVKIDPGLITYRHRPLEASAIVRVKNPEFSVVVGLTNVVNPLLPDNKYLYGNGLAQSADRVWALYLDVQDNRQQGLPVIEMEMIEGEGACDWITSGSIEYYQGTHSLTLACRVYDPDGQLVDTFRSSKTLQGQRGLWSERPVAPAKLATNVVEDVLEQFFASRPVMDMLEVSAAAPIAGASGDFDKAKAATVARRFVLGETRESAVLAEVGPGTKAALPEGDAICYRSGKGKQEFRYVFGASGTLTSVVEISKRGDRTDWSQRLRTSSPAAVATREPKPSAAAPSPTGRTFVLIVGVNTYEDKTIQTLRFAENDARSLYGFYASHGLSPTDADRVKILLGKEATRRNVLTAVRKHLEQKATGPNDTAVFYFAGHGFADAQSTYLACHDSELEALPETAIAMNDLQSRWSKIKAGTRLFVADACHSGGLANLRGLSVKTRFKETKRAKRDVGTIFIAAASQSQLSVENPKLGQGVFTNALVNGLKGDADLDGDRRVTVSELSDYLKRKVPEQATRVGGEQTPVLRFGKGASTVTLTR
jgi:hypothetical protein